MIPPNVSDPQTYTFDSIYLENGMTYCFVVVPHSDVGVGEPSDEACFVAAVAPDPVSGTSIDRVVPFDDDTEMNIVWEPVVSDGGDPDGLVY